jgi:membrane-bound lytic murein transglycosylase D
MRTLFAALFFAALLPVAAQSPQVPHKMEFAGITLTIRDDAQREIQKEVDALTQSPKHYNIKAERAKTYFPIIEKIFREEQLPDDFKYLALQESALIADAVSTSNAVGFWQFKDFTAIEMGLRVDREIDERMNIVTSSRAAARYIKKNNGYFNNWIYALQAYQMGAGGVLKSVKDNQSGARHMEITSRTYWYVKKYLAHKIAYESGVSGKGQTEVLVYENSNGKSISALAREIAVDESELRAYNKWTKSGHVPADKTYMVLIPVEGSKRMALPAVAGRDLKVDPKTTSSALNAVAAVKKKINGIQTIQALAGEDAAQLASRAGVDLSRFLKWNDLSSAQPIIAGNFYFLAKKRVRASENFHKVMPGEDLWLVSQRYGVQLKKLKKFNGLSHEGAVPPGTMLWLASVRPKSAVQMPVENVVAVDDQETFNWSADSKTEGVIENKDTLTVITVSAGSETPLTETGVLEKAKPLDSVEIVQESNIQEPATAIPVDTLQSVRIEPAPVRKTFHTVQAGETLYAIAKMHQIGVMDLVNWNGLDLKQGIKPGLILKLSENQPITQGIPVRKASKEVFHEVKSSDTLYSIARQYGVTIKELMDWNEKKDFSLAVGEKLKIHQHQ